MSTNITNKQMSPEADGATARRYTYLMPKRNSAYKQLFVLGRIFPWTIYGAYVRDEERMTIEEIAADYDIPVEAVQEAIEYYESNPPEMLEDFRREDALAEATGMNDPNYKYNPRPKLLTAEERVAVYRAAAKRA
jgi:uncharacterized protein (DUF433 family)